jgi:hypothetical protein
MYRCIALLKLLYRWQPQSRKLWTPPVYVRACDFRSNGYHLNGMKFLPRTSLYNTALRMWLSLDCFPLVSHLLCPSAPNATCCPEMSGSLRNARNYNKQQWGTLTHHKTVPSADQYKIQVGKYPNSPSLVDLIFALRFHLFLAHLHQWLVAVLFERSQGMQ